MSNEHDSVNTKPEDLKMGMGHSIEDEEYNDEPLVEGGTDFPGGDGSRYPTPPPEEPANTVAPPLGSEFDFDMGESYAARDGGEVEYLEPSELIEALGQVPEDAADLEELKWAKEYETKTQEELGRNFRELPAGTNPNDLGQTGWGVIFARGLAPAVQFHLQPLLDHRKEKTHDPDFHKDEENYRYWEEHAESNTTAQSFLWYGQQVSPGVLDLDKAPFYWLIVGSPEQISWEFQYMLQVNHAVGRIYFEDPADYGRYAESVLRAENQGVGLPKRAVFFSVEDGDEATKVLAEGMVAPVSRHLASSPYGWDVQVQSGAKTSKHDLAELLGGEKTPGLVLVSSHGAPRHHGADDQLTAQGAPTCRRVPGETSREFLATDLPENPKLHGQIAFFFPCYGAGTPEFDNFPDRDDQTSKHEYKPKRLAEKPFVAALPRTMLANGALAVVGHIDRGWTLSFQWKINDQPMMTIASLKDTLDQLVGGRRLGSAMRALHRRLMSLAAYLTDPLERVRKGQQAGEPYLAFLWRAHNDARNFVILGDPAVQALAGLGSRPRPYPEPRGDEKPRRGLPVFLKGERLHPAIHYAQHQGITVNELVDQILEDHFRSLNPRRDLTRDLAKLIRSWEELLATAEGVGSKSGQIRALNELGRAYRALGETGRAVECHEKQLQLAREIDDRGKESEALGNLGLALRAAGRDRDALERWQELFELAEARGDKVFAGKTLGNLANVYRDLGDYAQAHDLYDERIQIAQNMGDPRGEVMGHWNRGELFEKLGQYEKAIEHMQRRVDYEQKIKSDAAEDHAAKIEELRARAGA